MKNRGLASGGAFDWFFQRISGIILLFMLLTHFFLLHFTGMELTFDGVKVHLAKPFWKVFNLGFLYLGTYHAIKGFFMILHDYVHDNKWRLILTGLLWTLGIFMLIVGSLTILSLKI